MLRCLGDEVVLLRQGTLIARRGKEVRVSFAECVVHLSYNGGELTALAVEIEEADRVEEVPEHTEVREQFDSAARWF